MSHLELPVSGMTCASCAARVERTLNGPGGRQRDRELRDGARNRRLRRRGGGSRAQLVEAVESAGYGATLPGEAARSRAGARSLLRARLRVSAVLARTGRSRCRCSAPLQFDGWEWARARARHARGAVGRVAVPPRGMARTAPPHRDDGHAHQHRHARRLAVVGRGGRDRRRARLPRGRVGGHGVRARRAAARVAARAAGRARRSRRCCAPGRATPRCSTPTAPSAASRSRSCASATASSCVPASGSRPTASSRTAPPRWTRRSSPASRARWRSIRATTVAGGSVNAGGRLVVRATRVGADTAPGADRAPRLRGAGGQGAGAAARRPGLGRLRARRRRAAARDARRLALAGPGRGRRRERGRRRPHHRLPLRAGPGDARRRSWSAPRAAPSSACSCVVPRCSSRRAASTPSCSTRPGRSRPGA